MGAKVAVNQARDCMHVSYVPLADTLSVIVLVFFTDTLPRDGQNAGIPLCMSGLQTELKTAIVLDLSSGLSA